MFLLKVAKSRQIDIDEELKQLDSASKGERNSEIEDEVPLKEKKIEGLNNDANNNNKGSNGDIIYERQVLFLAQASFFGHFTFYSQLSSLIK